jgi:hypothetical protein
MHGRRLKIIVALLSIVTLIAFMSLPALAQQPAPAPPANGGGLSGFFVDLAHRAAALIPLLQGEIEKPLLAELQRLSWFLAALVFWFGFARMWREESGAGPNVFFWFGRVVAVLAILGSSVVIINQLDAIGKEIAGGGNGNTALSAFYTKERKYFDDNYNKFVTGTFTVEPTGENIKPPPGGGDAVLGILYDVTSSPKDVNRKMETLSHDMPTLFSLLSFARGLISFGDFFLMLIGGFLMIAMRLAAPVMIAVAIDRNLAHKITYPFVWGVVALTLIWPIVSQIIRALAYSAGNLALYLGDYGPAIWVWDPITMQETLFHAIDQPYYTVMFALLIMTLAGLSLWASPVIAYKVASGQIYESVSSTVSGWTGAIVSAGVELYSSSMASAINYQADRTQAEGQYSADTTRAGAGLESGNLQVRANKIRGITSAQGAREGTLAGIEAGRVQQTMGVEAEKQFGLRSVEAQAELSKSDIWARKDLSVSDQQAANKREGVGIETDRSADTESWKGGKIIKGSEWLGGASRTVLADKDGKQTLAGRGAGSAIELGGGAYGLYKQYDSIQSRAAGKQAALSDYTNQSIQNQGTAAGRLDRNQDVYRERLKQATVERAGAYIGAANAGAGIAAGGANRSYTITVGGINRGAALDLQANQINYAGAVRAAGITRDASFEAARLRALSAVIGSVGHSLAREAGQGMTLRY